jgi:TetR/AcrR family transcriptional regulator of autoinduction and epiphytic fitness
MPSSAKRSHQKQTAQQPPMRRRPASNKTGRPDKADSEAISARILEVASRLFASQGYAATSVEQVVAACGIGKDTVYRRFPSKLALFEGVVNHAREQTQAYFHATMTAQKGDGLARLKRAARWLLEVNLDPTLVAFKRIAFSEALVVGKSVQASAVDPIMDHVIALISETQDNGVLAGEDPRLLARHMLYCIAIGPTVEAMLGQTTYSSSRAQNAYFEKAWALFLDGVRKRPI